MMKSNPRLLIVDDNEDNLYTLRCLLELEGFTAISSVGDGELAIEALEKDSFDLVLLDVMMPRLGGIEVLERMKAQGRLGDPPIIMISALDELDNTVRCIELGAVDYLPKPFESVLLRARIRSTLDRKLLQDEIKEHRDRMEAELNEARLLQIAMCPQEFPSPSVARPVDAFGTMESAREVGGDFFDLFDSTDGRLCFALGDVAGKGAPAALFMARTKDIVRVIAGQLRGAHGEPLEPGEILNRVNGILAVANPSCTFVTLFLALLDPATGDFCYSNAGHGDPYHLSVGGGVRPLSGKKGPPVGIVPRYRYPTQYGSLGKGDALFVCSDGVTEALNAANEFYGEGRLEAMLQTQIGEQARAIVDAVTSSVRQFAVDVPQADDITAMAVKWI